MARGLDRCAEWMTVEQFRVKMLDCDWQPLENERPFSAVIIITII